MQRVQDPEESKVAAHPNAVRPSAALVMPVMKLGLGHGDDKPSRPDCGGATPAGSRSCSCDPTTASTSVQPRL